MKQSITVIANCEVNDPEWVASPSGTPVEAAFSVALMDATWPTIESQLRIRILSETWPYLVRFASVEVDDESYPCPDELFDSIIQFAHDQFAGRVWRSIAGVFSKRLAEVAPGTFAIGGSFKIKIGFQKLHEFQLEVGPLVVPKMQGQPGGVIPMTEVSIKAELSEDLQIYFGLL